jgi:hypothetical protein
MAMQPIPGLAYRGHPCSYDDGVTPPVEPPIEPPVTPPVTPPSTGGMVYPAELQPKNKTVTTMPWVSGTRLSGPTITHENAWVVKIHTEAPSTRNVRLTAVEREGGPIHRIAILFRCHDGAVVSRIESSSITFNILVGQPPDKYKNNLDANSDYAMGIYNVHDEAGSMFSDLYL